MKIVLITAFLATGAAVYFINDTDVFRDPDSFYHAAAAAQLLSHGLAHSPDPLPFTLFHPYVDHHFLYHLLLAPFAGLFGPIQGIRIATALFAGLFAAVFLRLLHFMRVPYPAAAAVLLFANVPFLLRIALPKAGGLALILLFLGIEAMIRRRTRIVFLISLLFTLSYQAFLILLAAGAVFAASNLLPWKGNSSRVESAKAGFSKEMRNLAAIAAGILAGLTFNPYFPHTFTFLFEHIRTVVFAVGTGQVLSSLEWRGLSLIDTIITNLPLICVFLASLAVSLGRRRSLSRETWGFVLMSLLLFVLFLKARRFGEYFAPFCVAASFLALRDASAAFGNVRFTKTRAFIASAAAVLFIIVAVRDISFALESSRQGQPLGRLRAAGNYLAAHSALSDLICNIRWEIFPQLYYHRPGGRYLTGLEPRLLQARSPQMFAVLESFKETRGSYHEEIGTLGCDWIVVLKTDEAQQMTLDGDPRFERALTAEDSVVYRRR